MSSSNSTSFNPAHPVSLLAAQKDKIRMFIDYRELNSATKRLRYPLPNTASIFPNLAGSTIYASLKLRSGYHQLSLTSHSLPVSGQHS